MDNLFIVMPAYNEEGNIETVVDQWYPMLEGKDSRLVIADSDSTDLTHKILYVVDQGQHSLKVLFDMMMRPNVIPVLGNHEYMAIHCLRFLMQEITEESIGALDEGIVQGLFEWQSAGGQLGALCLETGEEFYSDEM